MTTEDTFHRYNFPEREQEILETLIALLAQCDELLHDLEEYDPKYDELITTTRAAYSNALAAFVAEQISTEAVR